MNPYTIIKSRYITEKSTVLEQLQHAEGKPSLTRCKSPKYVFLVDSKAKKPEIARAVELIYKEKNVKVAQVNTINVKPKRMKRGRARGKPGAAGGFKKAIVTLEPGDALDNV